MDVRVPAHGLARLKLQPHLPLKLPLCEFAELDDRLFDAR